MKGKVIILKFCEKVLKENYGTSFLDSCEDVLRAFRENNKLDLDGHCPNNYGLDNYKGLCEVEEVPEGFSHNWNVAKEFCGRCWDIALNLDVEEKLDLNIEQKETLIKIELTQSELEKILQGKVIQTQYSWLLIGKSIE